MGRVLNTKKGTGGGPGSTPTLSEVLAEGADGGNRAITGITTINDVKVYNISITQTGTDAPVITIYENSLSGTTVSSYENVGDYRLTLAGAFPINKTFIINPCQSFDDDGDAATYVRVRAFGDFLNITALDALNGGNNKEIESSIPLMIGVLVYP